MSTVIEARQGQNSKKKRTRPGFKSPLHLLLLRRRAIRATCPGDSRASSLWRLQNEHGKHLGIFMNSRTNLIVLGTRSFAEEVADLVADCEGYDLVAFGENWERARCSMTLLGRPIIWIDDLAPYKESHRFVCAIGTVQREGFIQQARSLGLQFATIQHPFARIARSTTVGEGTIVSAGVIIGAQTRIGSHVILNRGCLIGHHTTIADYVTIAPGANIAGRVRIGPGCFVGIGATIIEDLKIGGRAIIAAGSVVTKDVPDNVQVAGVPARITKEFVEGR